MSACSDEGGAPEIVTSEAPTDPYEDYIRSELAAVSGENSGDTTPAPTKNPNIRDIATDRSPTDPFVSSMENPDLTDPGIDASDYEADDPDLKESPTPTEDPNATPTPTPTPYITPDEFEVGTCCIYMNGESDSAYGTEIVTAINKARKDLGYKELVTNKGLGTCADRRTRELAALYSHTRPNGLPFYSLAPDYYKAEMLVINNQKAEETVDVMIKNDPISRNLIFTTKYQSIGASSFKTNGKKYTVVAFGL